MARNRTLLACCSLQSFKRVFKKEKRLGLVFHSPYWKMWYYTLSFLVPLNQFVETCVSDPSISLKTPVCEWLNVCAFVVRQSSGFLEVQSRPPLQRTNSFADDLEMEAKRDIFLLPVSHVSEWVSTQTSDKHPCTMSQKKISLSCKHDWWRTIPECCIQNKNCVWHFEWY